MLKRCVMGLVATCVATSMATAASAMVVAGSVYEDRPALALRPNFHPLPNVTVKLYRNDGTLVASDKTNEAGHYTFEVRSGGNYWVAVDSKSIAQNAWPEQTFGPAGSLCARPNGQPVTIPLEGPCFGGRSTNSDDASALSTSEHLAAIELRKDVKDVDFAFSFDVVTSAIDGERVQGSVRQFIENANSVKGPNRLRFVPLMAAPEQRKVSMGMPLRWWSVTFGGPLPALRDEDTLIDGTAYNYLSPASVSNIHPGRIHDRPNVTPEDLAVPRLERPELELVVTGPEGIACEARCGMRGIAVRGATVSVITRADARMEHVIIGAAPDVEPGDTGSVGLQIERGLTIAQLVLVTAQSTIGIAVTPNGRIDGDRLEVTNSGAPTTGGGIVLLSNGSSIRHSLISANVGAGIILGNPDGTQPASGNTIDGSTISTNQVGVLLSSGSSRNAITRNDIMWNRFGGVTIAPFEENPPRENRLSANRFDENGVRPIVFDLLSDPNMLAERSESVQCQRMASAVNGGVSPPSIESAKLLSDNTGHRVIIRGRACPGEVVEIYQSFVTSGVRDQATADAPLIRGQENERVTVSNEERLVTMPSIGEFNYLGATTTLADGTFEGAFPMTVVIPAKRAEKREETDIWATDMLRAYDPTDRAFSAIAIDAAGNTSEMSVRRQIEK